MLLVEEATFDQMPAVGVAAIGVEHEPVPLGPGRCGVVTILGEDMLVLAIVHGQHLAERVRAAIDALAIARAQLRCTFLECDEHAAFELACKVYHRHESGPLTADVDHPVLHGHRCPIPLCDAS